METETAYLKYQEIAAAINGFDRIIPWVRDADLTFDLNYNRSMHQEKKNQIEESRDEINEKFQRDLGDEDETPLYRAPDSRLVAPINGSFRYVREVEGDPATEGTELRPTDAEYIKDEDRDTMVSTRQGRISRAEKKKQELGIAPTDQEAYREEIDRLNTRRYAVPFVPVDPDVIRDDDNVDSEDSVNYSPIMHVFAGVPHPAKEPPEEEESESREEVNENA